MQKVSIVIFLILLCRVPFASAQEEPDRKTDGYWLAYQSFGATPDVIIKESLKNGVFEFFAQCYHMEDRVEFPGLSQEEVDRYIADEKYPYQTIADNLFPFVVRVNDMDESYTPDEYWKALEDYLSQYNRLVLHALNSKHNLPLTTTAHSIFHFQYSLTVAPLFSLTKAPRHKA